MGTIYIVNQTNSVIHVRITQVGQATLSFYDVNPGETETWTRDYMEVAFILKDEDGSSSEFVVTPGQTYNILS